MEKFLCNLEHWRKVTLFSLVLSEESLQVTWVIFHKYNWKLAMVFGSQMTKIILITIKYLNFGD